MPSNKGKKKKTKEEEEDEWRQAALAFNELAVLESKCPAFVEALHTGKLDGGKEMYVSEYANSLYDTISGVGSTAKLRTRFMDCMMPIPDTSFMNYSRMGPRENAAGLWMGLGFDKVINGDISWHMDAIKEDANGKMYLPLPRMTMPEPADYPNEPRNDCHTYAHALSVWFAKEVASDGDEIGAVCGRLYPRADSMSAAARTRRSVFITELLKIKDMIEEVEVKRGELCELSKPLLEILKNNLKAFDVDADNDSGSDSDSDEAVASKKQKTTCKRESVQKVDISTIEAIGGKGLNDPRHARRKDFMGEVDAHLLEYLMYLYLAFNPYDIRLPHAVAPHYSSGANLLRFSGKHRFELPGDGLEGATIMTQKWNTTHSPKQRKKEMDMYLQAHDQASEVNKLTGALVDTLRDNFEFALVFESADPEYEPLCVLHSPELSLLQKKALFNVFMTHIWKPTEPAAEEEEEEEEEESSSSDEDEEEFEDDGEEDSDDEEDDSSGADSDDDDDDDDASEGSSSGSDDD